MASRTQAHPSPAPITPCGDRPGRWREALAPYARPNVARSLLDIATSVVPYFALSAAMYVALQTSYALTLAIGVLTAGFLLRTYMVFHDCAHGSFLPSKRANKLLGLALGPVVLSSFEGWRRNHVVHHATSGNLDRRGVGDVWTLTVAEYRARTWQGRLGYRLFRNPLVMFGLGPIFSLLIVPRIVPRAAPSHIRRCAVATNVALGVAVGALCWLVGWRAYLMVWAPPVLLAGAVGVWLFYVQHQFEDAYWQSVEHWSYVDAALRGSSYLRLPKALQFFTASIGLHHVHHLNARIPNYNLQRAHDENPIFHRVPTLSLRDGVRAVRLKLWDEERGRLVTFAQARGPRRRAATSSGTRAPASASR
jgi:omega-6 fatty acid desaturase (delta-12 desaturase)